MGMKNNNKYRLLGFLATNKLNVLKTKMGGGNRLKRFFWAWFY
jgi:hypothetical protein